jgi:WhiB family redox-sensing transcriptional regulator
MAQRLEWKEQAACRNLDTSLFFPESESGAEEAKKVCAICPVREACLQFALNTRQHDGVWGGLTESERRRVRRQTAPRRTEAA